MRIKMWWSPSSANVLDFIWMMLFFVGAASAFLIWISARPSIELTVEGFNYGLDLFKFPITCITGALAVITARVAVAALLASGQQSAAASWALIQNNFATYAGGDRHLPVMSLNSNPFIDPPGAKIDSRELFEVVYMSPQTTLRRLFDGNRRNSELEPPVNRLLVEILRQLSALYALLRQQLADGDVLWLATFADIAILARRLRLYLALGTKKMEEWDSKPPLENNQELGKKYLPPFASPKFDEICSCIRVELLCVVDALHFCQALEEEAQAVFDMAMGIGTIWASATDNARDFLTKSSIDNVWRESWKLHNIKIVI